MTHLLNNFIVFSGQYKNEEKLGHSFFQNFKAALDNSEKNIFDRKGKFNME